MFAIVEFDNRKKEFYVIPLIWLTDDKTNCYWPQKVKDESHLTEMIHNVIPPEATWKLYPIKKVHYTAETFDDANSLFKTILEQNSGSDSTHNVITRTERTSEPSLSDELVENANCNDGSSTAEEPLVKQQTKRAEESTREKNKQLKMSKPQYSKGHNQNKDSSNDYEIEMLTAEKNTKNYGTKTKVSCQVDSQTHNSLISSSSDEEEQVTEPLVRQQTKRAEESTREKNKRMKMSKPQYSKGHNQNKDSSNDYEIEMLTAENNTKNYGTKTKVSCQVDSQTHNSLISSSSDEEERVTPQLKNRRMQYTPLLELSESSSRRSTPLRDSIHNVLSANYQEKIIKDLESLKAIQEQHSIVLQEILATVRTKNVQALTRPADTPDLPIDHKKEFSTFESWLENPTNLTYMRSRLAAVGGSTVRGATMNVMKYLITNKIGMRFNWAGSAPKDEKHQRKYPFKDTKMFALINDAVKLTFSGRESMVELSDQVVIRAVQDWLKLSKSRYCYNSTK